MLLLVVLSLLVLFMLIGTAFLMSSNQYRHSATASAKLDRLGNYPTKLLDRAVMQVIRDTGEPDSAVRYHSLLRDLYGSDGFQAVVYSPLNVDLSIPAGQTTRYAAVTSADLLGPTQGQLIDVYVRQLAFSADDPLTPFPPLDEANPVLLERDARHVIQLERGVTGLTQAHDLPLTKGYYNGCLLTVTAGPASGQSTRIVDYEYIADIDPALTDPVRQTRLFRFRVMAFPRSDGSPLTVVQSGTRAAEISDLAGATFIVNGRPFNGTGTGFNELAAAGQPRLNAVETVGLVSDKTKWLYPEIALTPNAAFFFTFDPLNDPSAANRDLWGARYLSPSGALPLNPTSTNSATGGVALANRPLLWKYQTFVGPGDSDESYDAPDFQNLPLAMQTVTPRARGRVVQGQPDDPRTLEVDDPGINRNQFLRLDLEDLPLPSYFRPDLENYWFHRLLNEPFLVEAIPDVNERVRAILGDPTYVFSDLRVAGQIAALKRKISLRPLREDHPNFDGSNPASRPPELDGETGLVRNGNIAIPFWEAVGPWDVDNDNDGVPDSVWVDLGDPVAQAEDGTLYKPMYAFLIVDLDSRLNVNAHGLVEDLRSPQLDATFTIGGPGNLSHDITLTLGGVPTLNTSNYLASGSGYGPAEISLRSVFSPNLPGNANATLAARVGNPAYDDYARILVGRPAVGNQPSVWGRHGSVNIRGDASIDWTNNVTSAVETLKVRPGIPYQGAVPPAAFDFASADRLALFKFIGYPTWLSNYYGFLPTPSAFSTPPDLQGRFALGLDYAGQPVTEARADAFFNGDSQSLLLDSPYELNLSDPSRRGTPDPSIAATISGAKLSPINDDAPFATADLERILRAYDADAGALPDRLWNVVDAFDPLKLFANQPAAVLAQAQQQFSITNPGNAELLAAAQQLAGVTRRQVTTDSYDLPAPGGSLLSRLTYGADGQPGIANSSAVNGDDDGNGTPDDPSELGWQNSDDWYAVMYRTPTPENPTPFNGAGAPTPAPGIRLTPDHPTIVDLLKYRIQYERWKHDPTSLIFTEPQLTAIVNELLSRELLAGGKMDLNRPFGDGGDNPDPITGVGNGIVDDPAEAGEPFLDVNGNGKWDSGEKWIDVNADEDYNPPLDELWRDLAPPPIGSGVLGERIAFDYTNGHGEPLHNSLYTAPINLPTTAVVRNLNSQGRQLYARQLYCLMMLLVDENYLELPNVPSLGGDNINLEWFLEAVAEANGRPNAPNDVDREQAMRRLTARRIAQWAINCVDERDADSIMTTFEYDENPWDGWGTLSSETPPQNIPLDGDAGTDENKGEIIDWAQVQPRNGATPPQKPLRTISPPVFANQTRGVVFGVERPELLITETLALHDRRCTDESTPDSPSVLENPTPPQNADYDLDQRLKPRSSLFVELFNPWTKDGSKPKEFYGQVTANPSEPANSQGVMLNRLSNLKDFVSDKYSPVWRMAVLVDPINGRMTNQVIDMTTIANPANADAREALAAQFLSTDPDGFPMDMDEQAERHVYFTTGTANVTTPDPVGRTNDNELQLEYRDLNNEDADPTNPNLNVHVPPLPYRKLNPVPDGVTSQFVQTGRRYFLARNDRQPTAGAGQADVTIAPILPGRYGVIGSSNLQLVGTGATANATTTGQITQRFVTPLSRLEVVASGGATGQINYQTDDIHVRDLARTRRIELWPDPNGRPDIHQVLVAANGGPEFVHVAPNAVANVTDPNGDGILPNAPMPNMLIDPAVAIPVEDLNASEPVEGYPSLRYRELYAQRNHQTLNELPLSMNSTTGEEEYAAPFYDRPLDMEFELVRNGTTQNYRSIHLQRLANPLLPWNPPPLLSSGQPNKMHRPWLPVNLYRTIDSQSVDVTAFNGATTLERELPTQQAQNKLGVEGRDLTQSNILAPLTAGQYLNAPDHVLRALIYLLKKEGIPTANTPAELRGAGAVNLEASLSQLERIKGTPLPDMQDRGRLASAATISERRNDGTTYDWSEEWGWHIYRRVLPDDQLPTAAPEGSFRQWLNLQSLERGSHNRVYYKFPLPNEFYWKYNSDFLSNPDSVPEGWTLDLAWTPRLLWKQERPNGRLFLRGANGIVDASDLKTTTSRRILADDTLSNEERTLTVSQADIDRNQLIWNQLNATTTQGKAVVDFVLEQSLGFANHSFVPEMSRNDGTTGVAMLTAPPARGAPEVARDTPTITSPRVPIEPLPAANAQRMDATMYDVSAEVLNFPQKAARLYANGLSNAVQPSLLKSAADSSLDYGNATAATDKAALETDFYDARRRLMRSTYSWLKWNDRPFVSTEELTQVPGSSSSLMLRDYSVPNLFGQNPYDGDGTNPGAPPTSESYAQRIQIQQAPFGHLLNFVMAHTVPFSFQWDPSTTPPAPKPVGAPNYYRILDYVEVPSRYVGTDTLLSPEVFNDVPGAQDGIAPNTVGTDITGPTDPRYGFQPPFNKVSRERDPGRVNLNTVTGRRIAGSETSGVPARIWSEVYDGIMHRYQDNNLLANPGAINPTVLQLGHFGPAWRDVELSRRGYAQYNADQTLAYNKEDDPSPVDKMATQPDTFAFGLSKDFPSIFCNPFRAADAGDLVPLDRMVRPGVEATWLRSHPYARANDAWLETHPFSSRGAVHSKIAWGVAGEDDDRNGIVDDIHEAGFGDVNADDGDRLRIDDTKLKALGSGGFPIPDPLNSVKTKDRGSSGIPLFSESLPEPAIDAERNPGMMYQPMTRLGNLVTTRSNVYAIWVTVGYFEVEKAPDWNDLDVRERFGGTTNNTDDETVRARALYDRVYPEGYMLGEELGTDTGNTKRPRAFYIIDRTEPVGFKPGEDLNVERMIRVRRRIE